METILLLLGTGCIIAGFIGSFLPVIPGPPISYLGLIFLELTAETPFSLQFMVIWAIIVGVVMILDNVIPAYGTKKFGGSPYGVTGSVVGLLVGVFFSPLGLVIGPLIGAFLGELMAGKTSDRAFRSALGSFIGFLAGTILKVIATGMMGYYFFITVNF